MQNSKLQFKNYLLATLVIFASFLVVAPVFAAETFFRTKTPEIRASQLFEVGVFINTDKESVNAIEGKIIFPQDLLEIKNVNDGNSVINFWIEKPKSASEGQIAFSGIIPGGYNDSQGLIFSITFLAKKEGDGAIEFNGVKTLRNDGQGTEVPLTNSNFQFLISKQIPTSQIPKPAIRDTEPPERFKPEIAQSREMFDGKYFLVFATQDKGSGVDHYEIREGFWGGFVTAEGPYLLQNQKLDKKIFVKAVDKNGNERVEIFFSPNFRPWYKNYWILAILIIGVILIGYIVKKVLWQKFIESR